MKESGVPGTRLKNEQLLKIKNSPNGTALQFANCFHFAICSSLVVTSQSRSYQPHGTGEETKLRELKSDGCVLSLYKISDFCPSLGPSLSQCLAMVRARRYLRENDEW